TAHKFAEAASLAASLAAAAFAKAQGAMAQAKYWQDQANAAWESARQHLDASHGWNPISDAANLYDAGKETAMALYDEARAAYYIAQYGLLEAAGYTLRFAAEKAKSSAAWFTARGRPVGQGRRPQVRHSPPYPHRERHRDGRRRVGT